MATDLGIVHVDSVRKFFEEAVSAALDRSSSLTPATATTAYLVELLCEFIARPPDLDEPLSEMVLPRKHSAAARWTRIAQLKRAGDHSLYVAGYFQSSLRRRALDLEYYSTMGGTAYRRLSDIVGRAGETRLRHVYRELALDFPEFAALLAEVRAQTGGSGADPLALYEEWLETGSDQLRQRLQRAGFVISPRNCKNN